MTEETDDEQITSEMNEESEPSLKENISSDEHDRIKQTQAWANMEVHHHSSGHDRKNWKAYFWEFLMLFLAVFCGFLAEYKLEHLIEHQRAKVFAASMIDDLMADTAQLTIYIKQVSYDSDNVDTLFQLLANDEFKDIPTGKLYWYGLFGGAQRSFLPNDATLQQMKYSGSLRYFKNKTIGRQVARYDQLARNITEKQQSDMMLYTEVRKLRGLIFEARYNQQANLIFSQSRFLTNKAAVDSFVMTQPPLLTTDKTVFNQYVEMVRSRNKASMQTTADSLLHTAAALIINLREEYHVE